MTSLVQLIYCSAAAHAFDSEELGRLLAAARAKNAELGLTGILLYTDGSFFQVLEGEPQVVDEMFQKISRDNRHKNVTVIIREALSRRSFEEWTMGYASLTPEEADSILGAVDFFRQRDPIDRLGAGRAKRLLDAFKAGRWRSRLENDALVAPVPRVRPSATPGAARTHRLGRAYSYAYQPIVDRCAGEVFSYEALVRGANDEPAGSVFRTIAPADLHAFDEASRITAIELAAKLGLEGRLNLNFLPRSLNYSPTAIRSTIDAARRCGIPVERLVLEVLEREIIDDLDGFNSAVDEHRASGLLFAIDDFGSGHAGLSLLADFQPDFVKLDMELVRDIDRRGPRQAIVRGILRTCQDLGIEVIAEGVESASEYRWLSGEGIRLFQGYLLCRPNFEHLSVSIDFPTD